jgi:hypothetical protein
MTHPWTTTVLLVGLVAAGGVAWSLGGAVGSGALLGYLLGSGLCAFGVAWQTHWLRRRPARAMRAQLEAFLAKLFALLGFVLVFRFTPVFEGRVDWRAFALAYGAAVAVVLPVASWETLQRLARDRQAAPRPVQPTPSRSPR